MTEEFWGGKIGGGDLGGQLTQFALGKRGPFHGYAINLGELKVSGTIFDALTV